jgi:hypothetical protein
MILRSYIGVTFFFFFFVLLLLLLLCIRIANVFYPVSVYDARTTHKYTLYTKQHYTPKQNTAHKAAETIKGTLH